MPSASDPSGSIRTHIFDSCCRPGFDVTDLIADQDRPRKVQIEINLRLQDHARQWLSPIMGSAIMADAMLGMIGTMIDLGDRRVARAEAFAHPLCQSQVGGFVINSARDAGLVGDDDHQPA